MCHCCQPASPKKRKSYCLLNLWYSIRSSFRLHSENPFLGIPLFYNFYLWIKSVPTEIYLLGITGFCHSRTLVFPHNFCIKICFKPVCFWVPGCFMADPMESALLDLVSDMDNTNKCNHSPQQIATWPCEMELARRDFLGVWTKGWFS